MQVTTGAQSDQRWTSRLRALAVVHPFPALANAIAVAATMVVIGGTSSNNLALATLSAGAVHAGIGSMNDFVDAEADRVSNPRKPIAAGIIGRPATLVLSLCCALLGLLASAVVSSECLAVALVVLAAGMAYNFALKPTPFSWLPYAVFIPSIPVWAFVALDRYNHVVLFSYILGSLLSVALNLANTLPDHRGDARNGLKTLLSVLGPGRAKRAIVVLLAATVTVSVAANVLASQFRAAALTGALCSTGLALLLWLYSRDEIASLKRGWHAAAIVGVVAGVDWSYALAALISLR